MAGGRIRDVGTTRAQSGDTQEVEGGIEIAPLAGWMRQATIEGCGK